MNQDDGVLFAMRPGNLEHIVSFFPLAVLWVWALGSWLLIQAFATEIAEISAAASVPCVLIGLLRIASIRKARLLVYQDRAAFLKRGTVVAEMSRSEPRFILNSRDAISIYRAGKAPFNVPTHFTGIARFTEWLGVEPGVPEIDSEESRPLAFELRSRRRLMMSMSVGYFIVAFSLSVIAFLVLSRHTLEIGAIVFFSIIVGPFFWGVVYLARRMKGDCIKVFTDKAVLYVLGKRIAVIDRREPHLYEYRYSDHLVDLMLLRANQASVTIPGDIADKERIISWMKDAPSPQLQTLARFTGGSA